MESATNANRQYGYVKAIDGLRAIAVLAVMLYHLNPAWLPGGFAGVDVFFVISGYVVARSLAGRMNESKVRFITGFYARRVRRILPALTVCLVITSLMTVLFIPASWLSATTSQVGLFAFFGLSNIALVLFQDDYFSPRAEYNPFVHTWSLGVEEQFYLLFPFLVVLGYRVARRQDVAQSTALLGWSLMPLMALGSLYLAYWMGAHHADKAYYLLPSRFWELAAGVMLFQLQDAGRLGKLGSRLALAVLTLGLALIAVGYWWADVQHFPYPWALFPVAGAVLAIHALSWRHTDSHTTLLNSPLMVYCGKISFSLYLWHWPVYTLLRWTVGLESGWSIGAALLMTFALAMASYHWVETPIRRTSWLRERRAATIMAGVAATALLWAVSLQLFQHREALSRSVTADTYTWYPYAYPAASDDASPKPMAGRTLFVIGNSHTGAYSTMLHQLRQQHGVEVRQMETGACAIGNMLYPVNDMPGCRELSDRYLAQVLEQATPGDMVFLASLRTYRLSDQWMRSDPGAVLAHSASETEVERIEQARQETMVWAQKLAANGIKVLIDAPKPVLKAPPYRCSDWFNREHPLCTGGLSVSREYMQQLREPVVNSIQSLQRQLDNVYYWDPLPLLCNQDECPAFDDSGKPLFFDGDHLSGHGNRVLYPGFLARLQQVW